jgi:hypothetical protein
LEYKCTDFGSGSKLIKRKINSLTKKLAVKAEKTGVKELALISELEIIFLDTAFLVVSEPDFLQSVRNRTSGLRDYATTLLARLKELPIAYRHHDMLTAGQILQYIIVPCDQRTWMCHR